MPDMPRTIAAHGRSVALVLLGALLPLLWLEGLQRAAGVPFDAALCLARWLFVALVLLAAFFTCPQPVGAGRWRWPWAGVALLGVGGAAALLYALTGATSTGAAWLALAGGLVLLPGLDSLLTQRRCWLWAWLLRGMLALAAGAVPLAVAQVETGFAEEEFFVTLEALALAGFCALLLVAGRLVRWTDAPPTQHGLLLRGRWPLLVLLVLALGGAGVTVARYQRSFYPQQAPGYAGISAAQPFLCGNLPPQPGTVDGQRVWARLLERVAAKPTMGAAEYGMLALATGDDRQAQHFRESLLADMQQGRFTGAAGSVKSVQHDAALRVYYYQRMREAFPALFSAEEQAQLGRWFAAINRRALTAEWVDWLYALAFRKWPEGPYENQESGAALLALLQESGLADPQLAAANRAYLARQQRGWQARFRNTDDAFHYQPIWVFHAYLQALHTGEIDREQARRSFDWLLLQALPDGAPLNYNHKHPAHMAGALYLGAALLGEDAYLWQASKELAYLERHGLSLPAQPGSEQPLAQRGSAPTRGTCLLYGDSGLPNQAGALAPDKIVFRDGWADDSAYLLLNLRFTGWHRYKATNAVVLYYQGGALVAEDAQAPPAAWLPEGRSLFRDKRMPRENLNGLLIEHTGMRAVLHTLTGLGSPWAQNPPAYARVEHFETGPEMDRSTTVLDDWQGWQHRRSIFFYHQGPVVIVDEAAGPPAQAALRWHVAAADAAEAANQRVLLRAAPHPVEMRLLPVGAAGHIEQERLDGAAASGRAPALRITYHAAQAGRLHLVTLLLPGEWAGATAAISGAGSTEGRRLHLVRGDQQLDIPLDGQ